MAQPDYTEIKQELEARLDLLKKRVTGIDDDLREPGSKDFEERATETEGDEVLESLGNAGLVEISQIQSALSRMENGNYGICGECGADILEERLKAVPYAAKCIDCAGN
jgi:DnaK suppressor protein